MVQSICRKLRLSSSFVRIASKMSVLLFICLHFGTALADDARRGNANYFDINRFTKFRILPKISDSMICNGADIVGEHGETITVVRDSDALCEDANGILNNMSSNKPRIEPAGLLLEASAANYILYNRDYSNAAWTASNITGVRNAVGKDGQSNHASTLTATGSPAMASQHVDLPDTLDYYLSAYIKRKTGTGTVGLTKNNGASTTDITGLINSSTYTRVGMTFNDNKCDCGIVLGTSGDEVYIDYTQLEVGTYATSAIETTTEAVARNDEKLTFVPPYNSTDTFCLASSVVLNSEGQDTSIQALGNYNAGASELLLDVISTGEVRGHYVDDGLNDLYITTSSPFVTNTVTKRIMVCSQNKVGGLTKIYVNNAPKGTSSSGAGDPAFTVTQQGYVVPSTGGAIGHAYDFCFGVYPSSCF